MGKRISILLFILLPITLFAQSKSELITHIRQVFQLINTDAGLKKVTIDNEQLLELDKDHPAYDGGEEITGYFKQDTLVKIVIDVGLSNGNTTIEYYLDNGEPVFIYQKQTRFAYNDQTGAVNYSNI